MISTYSTLSGMCDCFWFSARHESSASLLLGPLALSEAWWLWQPESSFLQHLFARDHENRSLFDVTVLCSDNTSSPSTSTVIGCVHYAVKLVYFVYYRGYFSWDNIISLGIVAYHHIDGNRTFRWELSQSPSEMMLDTAHLLEGQTQSRVVVGKLQQIQMSQGVYGMVLTPTPQLMET